MCKNSLKDIEILDKPDVDKIEGLSPAIAIDQKTTSKNPNHNLCV